MAVLRVKMYLHASALCVVVLKHVILVVCVEMCDFGSLRFQFNIFRRHVHHANVNFVIKGHSDLFGPSPSPGPNFQSLSIGLIYR